MSPMKVAVLSVLLAVVLAGPVAGKLLPPHGSYKVLMLLPVSARSHRAMFVAVAEALAERGHKVVMLTNHAMPATTHPNISEVFHGLPHRRENSHDLMNLQSGYPTIFKALSKGLRRTARDLYQVAAVKELYRRRKEFDVILVDYIFNDMALPFVHEVPFITVNPAGLNLVHSAVLGNFIIPSHVCRIFDGISLASTWQRLTDVLDYFIFWIYYRSWVLVPAMQEEISLHFPELPQLRDLEKNQSLAMLNSHFDMGQTAPLLPSQVEVGTIHCRPATPLPTELESWMAGAGDAGVVYFSLGSLTRGTSIPKRYLDVLMEAFRRLPHRILWKYEGELQGASNNVRTSAWLPQQDILGHKQVRVFLSHAGLLSLQEAVYHGTPIVALPIFGDQPQNGYFVKDAGLGHLLMWEELTADDIVAAVTDVANNPRYKENVEQMSIKLRDQPMTPQERAVFWTEYVIRHRGAPHLKPPIARLSWLELLLLDVATLMLVGFLVFLVLVGGILKVVRAVCRGKTKLE